MIDKVQKIREEVEILKLCTMDEHMKFYSESAEAEYNALCRVEKIIDSLQEEPVNIWHDASKETPTQGSNILMFRKVEKDTNYPPIAGCFHGTNSRLDGRNWGYYNGFCFNEIEPPVKWAYIDELLKLSEYDR